MKKSKSDLNKKPSTSCEVNPLFSLSFETKWLLAAYKMKTLTVPLSTTFSHGYEEHFPSQSQRSLCFILIFCFRTKKTRKMYPQCRAWVVSSCFFFLSNFRFNANKSISLHRWKKKSTQKVTWNVIFWSFLSSLHNTNESFLASIFCSCHLNIVEKLTKNWRTYNCLMSHYDFFENKRKRISLRVILWSC